MVGSTPQSIPIIFDILKQLILLSLRFRQVNTEERGMCQDVERQQISDIVKDRESDASNYGDNELRWVEADKCEKSR